MIQISDTTLRDGAQAEGISFSLDDKIQIIRELDDLGISWIEVGNPSSNPLDAALFQALESVFPLRHAKITAFGSTCRPNLAADADDSLIHLAQTRADSKTIFGKSSLRHVRLVLRCSPEENLRMIHDSIAFLCCAGTEIWFDAEHYFDGYREDPLYALETLKTAEMAGAGRIILCDTNGGSLPESVKEAVTAAKEAVNIPLGIHCHNDCGLATANSLTALEAGCDLLQGTIGGIGERCGNADLCTLIPLVSLKLNQTCLPEGHLMRLTHIYRVLSEIMNLAPNESAPFVGYSAFAHKGGMHIDAVLKDRSTYEQVDPESVGNQRRFLVSDQSGRAGIFAKLGRFFPDLNRDSQEIAAVLKKLKEMESEGYTYENADGSFELLALETLGRRSRFFHVLDYHVLSQQGNGGMDAQAYLKIEVNGQVGINAAEGDGPVNALDLALRKTLSLFYPSIRKMRLKDFKVRVLNSQGTASKVRVGIESTDGIHLWKTVGVHSNIILASLHALVDSVDYMLTRYVSEEEIRGAAAYSEHTAATDQD